MFRNKGLFQHLQQEKKESALDRKTRQYFSEKMTGMNIVRQKRDQANLKLAYRKTVEICSIFALTLVIGTAQVGRLFSLSTVAPQQVDIKIEVADIPATEQIHRPPAPPRPSVPIPTESEDVPEDMTIASTEIDLSDIPAPPAPPDDDANIFVAYDEPPEIVGGLQALSKHLKYPRVARAAGLEGVVFVKVLVGVDGKAERSEVIQAKPANMGFEESALSALQKVSWLPAKQRDRKIRVWVSMPVQFKLVSS